MSRRIAREVAMKLVFSKLCGGEDTYQNVLEQSGILEPATQADMDYADEVLAGIGENLEALDEVIADLAIGWSIDRMPKVDIAIMRIAVYEMLHLQDMPIGVSINEAVELAKTFGGDKSSGYINGMLGTLAKRIEQEK